MTTVPELVKWKPGDTFPRDGVVWRIDAVNRLGRPTEVSRPGKVGGVSFGTAYAWREWLALDWRYR